MNAVHAQSREYCNGHQHDLQYKERKYKTHGYVVKWWCRQVKDLTRDYWNGYHIVWVLVAVHIGSIDLVLLGVGETGLE